MLKIVQSPEKVLFTQAKEIQKIDNQIKKLVRQMEETLLSAKDPEGVGLAAPQIGKSLRLFIAKPNNKSKITTYINPKISDLMFKKNKVDSEDSKLEGCLSIKDIWGVVDRADSLTLEYTDLKGVQQTKSFKGFEAIIIQHEIDHLGGILFTTRVIQQKNKIYQSSKNKKGEIEFEEISI